MPKGYLKIPVETESQQQGDIDIICMIDANNFRIILKCNGVANASVTNREHIIHHAEIIPDYHIGGIGKGIKCAKRGIYYLQCEYGNVLPVKYTAHTIL